ncbi:hypothetical protein D3C87_1581220 [compost metagenome]
MTSAKRWCSAFSSVPPIYMPGRIRTGSSPSSTRIDDAPYSSPEGDTGAGGAGGVTAATAAGFGCTFRLAGTLAAAVAGVFAASSFVSVSLFRAAGRPEKRSLLSSIMSKVQKRVSEFRHANHYASSVNHNAKRGSRPIEVGPSGKRGASYATIVSGFRNRRIALPALQWQVSQPRMNG